MTLRASAAVARPAGSHERLATGSRHDARAWIGPALVLAGVAAAILVASGVPAGDVGLFAAYELIFVMLPGCVLLFALGERLTGIRAFALGWSLGYLLEILIFILTAAFGAREWFLAYPLVAVAGGVLALKKRVGACSRAADAGPSSRDLWLLCLLGSVALAYLSLAYFSEMPLPSTIASVDYYKDTVHHLSLAGQAKHYWPITDPHVAGEPFAYYHFPFIHLAAVSQVTGIELPMVLFRLYLVPLFLLVVLHCHALGTTLTGRTAAGLLTVAFVLLIGELDVSRVDPYPFMNAFFFGLIYSPPFVFGLIFFLPFVTEVMVGGPTADDRRPIAAHLAVAILLLVGAVGSKGPMLPVLVASLGTWGVLKWRTEKQLDLALAAAFVAASVLMITLYFYGENRAESIAFRPLARVPWNGWLGPLGLVLGLAGLMGIRTLGMIWGAICAWRQPATGAAALTIVTVWGIVPFYLTDLGTSQFYFLWLSYVAASALASAAVSDWWSNRQRMGARVALTLSAAAIAAGAIDLPLDYADKIARWRSGNPTYSQANDNLTAGLWQALVWIRDHAPREAVLAVNNYSITPRHPAAPIGDYRYFYYSAFSERPVFLEGWMYSDRTHAVGYGRAALGEVHPFPERLSLNSHAFATGYSPALREMRERYGVTHVFVDKIHGADPFAITQSPLLTRVFHNDDADVYAMRR